MKAVSCHCIGLSCWVITDTCEISIVIATLLRPFDDAKNRKRTCWANSIITHRRQRHGARSSSSSSLLWLSNRSNCIIALVRVLLCNMWKYDLKNGGSQSILKSAIPVQRASCLMSSSLPPTLLLEMRILQYAKHAISLFLSDKEKFGKAVSVSFGEFRD